MSIRRSVLALTVCVTLCVPEPTHAEALPGSMLNCLMGQLGQQYSSAKREGPTVKYEARGTNEAPLRDVGLIKTLKVMQYNVMNLMKSVGKFERDPNTLQFKSDPSTPPIDKPEWALKEIAKIIKTNKPDLMVLEEVESLDALNTLAKIHLNGEYEPLLIQGNDTRGINIGFLVRKDLPIDIEIQSHKNITGQYFGGNETVFSRDLPVVILRKHGAPADSKPLAILMGTHFKSQRDTPRDPGGVEKRKLQVEETVRIKKKYQDMYGSDVPIIIAGDFNSDVRSAQEFQPLWNAGLKDAFDVKGVPKTSVDRVTETYHPRNGPMVPNQLDAIVVSPEATELVQNVKVIRYTDQNGREKPIPQSYAEREKNPSDHFPVLLELDFQKLLERMGALSGQ